MFLRRRKRRRLADCGVPEAACVDGHDASDGQLSIAEGEFDDVFGDDEVDNDRFKSGPIFSMRGTCH